MKLMYISGMYVPSHGGAEISVYSLLKNLKEKKGWDILVVTDERYKNTRYNPHFNKVPIRTVSHKGRLKEIDLIIKEFKPKIILTQLMWGDVALKLANKNLIPSIIRMCKVPSNLDLSYNSSLNPTGIISTSKYVKKYVKSNWKRKSSIIKPLVELENYIINKENFDPFNNKLIFMFNPLKRKGGLIFKEIAKKLPQEQFGTVFGWSSLKDNKNSKKFSKKYIKRITESEGSEFDGSLPEYINLADCPNIKIFKSEDNAKELYKKIKVLLIPSQWEEAFGRVAIEAMVNGIPVIASNIAGLKDSVGSGGVLLEKDGVNSWIKEIKELCKNRDYFKKRSENGKKFVKENYNEEKIVSQTIELVDSCINRFKKDKP